MQTDPCIRGSSACPGAGVGDGDLPIGSEPAKSDRGVESGLSYLHLRFHRGSQGGASNPSRLEQSGQGSDRHVRHRTWQSGVAVCLVELRCLNLGNTYGLAGGWEPSLGAHRADVARAGFAAGIARASDHVCNIAPFSTGRSPDVRSPASVADTGGSWRGLSSRTDGTLGSRTTLFQCLWSY